MRVESWVTTGRVGGRILKILLLTVSLGLAVSVVQPAAAELSFEQARKQANENIASSEGYQYLAKFLPVIDPAIGRALSICSQNTPIPVDILLVFVISADGKTIRLLTSDNGERSRCLMREIRMPPQVPRPPRDQWSVGAAVKLGY